MFVQDSKQEKSPSRGSTPEEDDSSLFDNDASWTSVTTPGGSPAQRRMTREQAREVLSPTPVHHVVGFARLTEVHQKAEILKLKLGLASYKVRTGQTDVPLSQLVAKPLPRSDASRQNTQHEKKEEQEQLQEKEDQQELPQLKGEDVATPKRQVALRDEERLTSSALRGGAASGLLSLARGALGE